MSIAVLLLAAVVLLGLEASGAGQGGRKQVSRVPQGVVVVVAALVVALLSPGPVSLTVAGALIAFALIEGSALLASATERRSDRSSARMASCMLE